MTLLDFLENSYYAQNVVNGSFLGPILTLSFGPGNAKKEKFYKTCFLDFFPKFYVMAGIEKKIKLSVFPFFKTTLITPKEPLFGS